MKTLSKDSFDTTSKKHKAHPMDAYCRTSAVKCIDNPDSNFVCKVARIKDRFLSPDEIEHEFEMINMLSISDTDLTI